jgi:hypothetical protein
MNVIAVRIALVLITLLPTLSFAQEPSSTPPSPGNSDNSTGTSPENRGSTGWTGGQRETTPTSSKSAQAQTGDDAAAADQPLMATGKDLNGPPKRFPANNTPE